VVVVVAGLGRAAAAPSLTCEEFTQAACEGPPEFSFDLATDTCYSKAEVQATLGLDATHASQLSAPFYSWAAAAGDALVVPIPCDDDECSAVRSPRSEYALGLVGPWVMGQCTEVQEGEVQEGEGWVSARAAVRSARCTVLYKTQAAFDVVGVLLYAGGAVYLLAKGVLWHRRTGEAVSSLC